MALPFIYCSICCEMVHSTKETKNPNWRIDHRQIRRRKMNRISNENRSLWRSPLPVFILITVIKAFINIFRVPSLCFSSSAFYLLLYRYHIVVIWFVPFQSEWIMFANEEIFVCCTASFLLAWRSRCVTLTQQRR